MSADDWTELAKSMGPVAAGFLFVLYVLAKNGMLKVVVRDNNGVDEIAILRRQIDDMNIRLSILEDRWDRKK